MLKTKFPYEKVDFEKYYDAYMKREDAIKHVPSEKEIEELAFKGLVKDHLVLQQLPEGESAQIGDTLTFRSESELKKFNKEKVTVSIGRGLYNKELEQMAVDKKVGDCYELTIQDKPVKVTILEIKRKQAPKEATDEMVVELQMKDDQQKPITTVARYIEYMKESKRMECLAAINYYVMEDLLKDYPVPDCDPDDIERLAELEKVFFAKVFKEMDGIDVYALTKEEAQEKWQCDSFDDFIKLRYEWYKMKIQQCLIYRNILGLENDPKFDYTDHYEVLSELSDRMFQMYEKRLAE